MFTLKKFFTFFFLSNVLFLAVIIMYVLRYHVSPCDSVKRTHDDDDENQYSGSGNSSVTKKTRSHKDFLNKDKLYNKDAVLSYCNDNPCLRKCCPLNEYLVNTTCVNTTANTEERHKLLKRDDIPFFNKVNNYCVSKMPWEQMFIGFPCKEYYESYFEIQENGMFKETGPDTGNTMDFFHNVFQYCFDSSVNGTSKKVIGYICFPPNTTEVVDFQYYYRYTIGTSIIFFIITLVAYGVTPDLWGDNKHILYGHCLMTHIFMLTVAFIAWMIMVVSTFNSYTLCMFTGYTFYFSFIAGFLWMNVMCYDLWWGIRLSRPLRIGFQLNELSNIQKYSLYFIYAKGTALLFTTTLYVMDGYLHEYDRFKPDMGNLYKTCFINNREAMKVFFYYPMGVILFINTILFVDTICGIKRVINNSSLRQNGMKNSEQIAKERKRDYEEVILYAKLFMMMGVTWFMEIISFIFAEDVSSYWWLPTDIINSLRGVFIFFIFVMKKKVIRRFKDDSLSLFSSISRRNNALFSSWSLNIRTLRKRRTHEQSESKTARDRKEANTNSSSVVLENVTEIDETG